MVKGDGENRVCLRLWAALSGQRTRLTPEGMASDRITAVWCGGLLTDTGYPRSGKSPLLHVPNQTLRRQHFPLGGSGHRTNAGGRGAVLRPPQPWAWTSPLQEALEICLPLLRTGGEAALQALQVYQEQPDGQVPGEVPPGSS